LTNWRTFQSRAVRHCGNVARSRHCYYRPLAGSNNTAYGIAAILMTLGAVGLQQQQQQQHPFNGPLSGTTQVSRYQKGKTDLDFTEARDSE